MCTIFYTLSTITHIELCFFIIHGKSVTKSIKVLFHFHTGISKCVNISLYCWCSTFYFLISWTRNYKLFYIILACFLLPSSNIVYFKSSSCYTFLFLNFKTSFILIDNTLVLWMHNRPETSLKFKSINVLLPIFLKKIVSLIYWTCMFYILLMFVFILMSYII